MPIGESNEFLRPNLMIDGAHNNESVKVLIDLLQSEYADKSWTSTFESYWHQAYWWHTCLTLKLVWWRLDWELFDYPNNSVKLDKYRGL